MNKTISRREMLGGMGVGIAGLALAPLINFSKIFDFFNFKKRKEEKRAAIIAQALSSKEGREALAQAMVEPIKVSLMYQSIGRKLLLVDELPQGVLPRYQRVYNL